MKEGIDRFTIPPEFRKLGETFGRLPYSDFWKWTKEGDIYERSFDNLYLTRLLGVKALSLLSYEKFDPERAIFSPFEHNRYEHSFMVGAIIGEILKLNGFSRKDINTGIVAGLIHDIATPAFGDVAKKVDPQALNEEKFWWQALGKREQNFITKELKISRKELDDVIHNKGILGQVLDIADRIAYTMVDLNNLPQKLFSSATNHDQFRLSVLQHILSSNPKIGNIYKEVKIDKENGKVYFENTKHLEIFLTLRAHLYSNLYLKPENQGRDLFAAKVLNTLYSRTNSNAPLTPQKLRLMQDEDLLCTLKEHFTPKARFSNEIYNDLVSWQPKYKEFGIHYLERAKKYAEELKKDKNVAVIGIQKCNGFDPATSYNVLDKKGNIIQLRETGSESALFAEELAIEARRVYVFYADISKEPEAGNNLLKSIFMQKEQSRL